MVWFGVVFSCALTDLSLMGVLEDIVMHEAWFCGGRFGVLASEK